MKNILTLKLSKFFLPERAMLTSHFIDNGENKSMLNATLTTTKLIAYFFSPINALASKPVITVSSDSVVVHVFYYIPGQQKTLNSNTVNNLGEALTKIFGRKVSVRLVALRYPYLNSYILAQYIALNAKNKTLVQIVRRIFSSVAPVKNTQSIESIVSLLPSHIVGIKVQLSGRLITERSRPRQTVQTRQIGSFSRSNLSLVEMRSFTTKNKKGAFTVKVWISQRAVV